MVKANRPDSQKAGSNNLQPDKKQQTQMQATIQPVSSGAEQKKGKQSGKSRQSAVGGTAVQGAKSTIPKELSTGTPADQQPEYYNRDTRRRMQQMGTGPYTERASVNPRERKKKRLERIKERQAQMKHTVDAKGPSRDIKLVRRNTYFLIGIIAAVIILIVVFLIIRHPF
jgi:hypothetical protein